MLFFVRPAPFMAALFLSTALASPAVLAQSAAGDGNVSVTRVTLATGGLAEVEGTMTEPDETMRLAIERALVADVLRTLVVTGPAPVRSIDLEAAEPVGERSQTGRLLSGDLSDPSTILQSLIGELVELRGGQNQLSGRLLAFDFVTIEGGDNEGPRPALRVAVVTDDDQVAFATFQTQEALAIEGLSVEERMAGVVPALRTSVDDGRRELTVRLDEPAKAGFSFVVPTTVWRPSYRAILGPEGTVDLQGWATLENTTGLDWNGVDLRLAVGTPVAYRQDVYAPLRSTRPAAPFEVGRTAQVPLVEREVGRAAAAPAQSATRRAIFGQFSAGDAEVSAVLPAPVPADLVTGAPAIAGSAATIFSVAGEIDLAAGRTLSVPFLTGTDNADRIAYLRSPDDRRAMDALELSFDAEATVPGGLIAVYDAAGFVGDARFAGADGGERTILPFAQSTDVNTTVTQNYRTLLMSARIADGSLRVRREVRRQIVIAAEASAPVTLVIDVPSESSEAMTARSDSIDIVRVNSRLVRLRVPLEPGSARIDLTGTRPILDQYRVGGIPMTIIDEVLAAGGAVDEATAARLKRVAEATARIAEIDRRINTFEADAADRANANAADRENLEAIGPNTPEGARVRARIVARTDDNDAAATAIQGLRQERLELERTLRNP